LRLLSTSTTSRLLALALFALSAVVGSAQTAKPSDAKSAAARERAKNGRMSVSEIRKLYEEISKQRDVMIADFEALAKQMKDATEEQKKQLKEKMEEQKKAFEEATNALQKQIREEQRRQRQNAAPGKR
jgi:gas vesicle protein